MDQPGIQAQFKDEPDGTRIVLSGRLDATSVAAVWDEFQRFYSSGKKSPVVLDAQAVDYCDVAGAGLILNACRLGTMTGRQTTVDGLRESLGEIVNLFDASKYAIAPASAPKSVPLSQQVGNGAVQVWKDFLGLAEFLGELCRALIFAAKHPHTVRWKDALRTADTAGVNALPVVVLVGFLIGFVMAFQSAIPMKRYGADVFIPTLVGLAMLRELGPIMTAVALAGRSSSAFAAELGTMKVSDEINALITLGLPPVRFLVVPRVIAAVLMTPILTVFGSSAGLMGGFVVFLSLGYPARAFFTQLADAVSIIDFMSGMVKGFAFGIVVAGIGCLRGLETKSGASAVGDSTTSAVVSSIVLVAVGDGIFAVVYYALGI